MSHAWLFTGPPGSGRSNAAVAFAAALQCEQGGCGELPRVPHRAQGLPRRRHPGPHREAVDRRRRGARPGPPRGARAGRPALADHDRRGRRPAHRAGLQRAAQGDRGADRPHRVDAVRPDGRGRAADDPLPLPAGVADDADRRPTWPTSWCGPTASSPSWRRTPPAPARATSAGRGRWPATTTSASAATRVVVDPGDADLARRLPDAPPPSSTETTKAEAEAITDALDARERQRARRGVRRGRARPPAPGVRPGARRAGAQPEDPRQAPPPRRGRPEPDGPGLGLPRRDRDRGRGARRAGQRGAPRRDRAAAPRSSSAELNLRRIGWIFEAREQMLEFNVPVLLALESMMVALQLPDGARR